MAPRNGLGSDTFRPLMEIWMMLKKDPKGLVDWYAARRNKIGKQSKEEVYESIKASYNRNPNGADFVFLSRACYGGIVRFRKSDGYMSTPCGAHMPIPVDAFTRRVEEWKNRLRNVSFAQCDYKDSFAQAKAGDLIYCDPPYSHSQSILYGAQEFHLSELLEEIEKVKERGIKVALSIDGHKKSGIYICDIPVPLNLFEQEIYVDCGRSMLRRFQLEGQTLERENVADRLLLTY
jgi:DNA adenine methylase